MTDAPKWHVRKPNGTYIGPFDTHAEALKRARQIPGGGTPVQLPQED
jgi:hypothetical protein